MCGKHATALNLELKKILILEQLNDESFFSMSLEIQNFKKENSENVSYRNVRTISACVGLAYIFVMLSYIILTCSHFYALDLVKSDERAHLFAK